MLSGVIALENTNYSKIISKPVIISCLSFYSKVYQFSCNSDGSKKEYRHLKSVTDMLIFHFTMKVMKGCYVRYCM